MRSYPCRLALCGLALFLCACSSDPSTARLISKVKLFSKEAPVASPVFVAKAGTTAPRMIAAVESKPDLIAVFVREAVSDSSGVGTWISPDGSQLMFDEGLLVGSRGFGGDVMASDVTQSAALVRSLEAGYATRLMTLIDGEDRAITRAFKCKIMPGAVDPVNIEGREVSARTATEDCRGDVASFKNFYWVVPGTGKIIQSSQWSGLVTGKISLRVVEPASAD